MTLVKATMALAVAGLMAACTTGGHAPVQGDKTRDRGTDKKHLSQLVAGIWVDPNGCDHWIIDDGVEGYADARRDKYGKPVCSNVAPPETATGPFKDGTRIFDPL
ncbi:hypothetical protein TL5118_00442 [Thalassovita autumnalis]|jgi:hypothetical protein|uniref:Lipoprotein n=1 Tax=Thalassovita autumnalis TaxID=2072972 RepID=A0A0P1FTG1_9RHOB|nr:hypothetical protein TL5118_00442 [Thalassovita autumnalis]CUH71955.1 hypothetical protein TL5120_01750 [Thalassovita autumnalis]|tara:strand:- start:89 stop:403 length:315 start_codon:yes stop_codon:yes gene_type:complete